MHSIIVNNALLQQPQPIAMHTCRIIPHGLYISDDVITDTKEYPHVEVTLKSKRAKSQPDPTEVLTEEKAHISVYSNAITISCNYVNGRWKAYAITVDFPRLYYRHNGRVIDCEAIMLLVLSYYLVVVDELVPPTCKGRALPGIVHGCASYWSMIEFPLQVDDPDGEIFKYCWQAKHSSVNKPEVRVPGQTVTWKGSEFTLRAYYKGQQLKDKYHHIIDDAELSILRIEVEYKKKKLRKVFNVPEEYRLTTFGFDDLYRAFHQGVSGLKGAFKPTELSVPKPHKSSQFIAGLITQGFLSDDKSTNDVLKLYAETSGVKDRQFGSVRTEVYKLLEDKSTLNLLDIFPADEPLPSVNLSPQHKNKVTKEVYDVERKPMDITVDPRIAQAYQSVDFVPYNETLASDIPLSISTFKALYQNAPHSGVTPSS